MSVPVLSFAVRTMLVRVCRRDNREYLWLKADLKVANNPLGDRGWLSLGLLFANQTLQNWKNLHNQSALQG
jgi:hypothetical protein